MNQTSIPPSTKIKIILKLLIVFFILVGCTPSSGTGVPDAGIAILEHPTGAMSWMYLEPKPDQGEYGWSFTNAEATTDTYNDFNIYPNSEIRSMNQHPEWAGVAFDMRLANFKKAGEFGLPDSMGVIYLLEYTLPESKGPTQYHWETELTFMLPNGVCFAHRDMVCVGDDKGNAIFLPVVFQDSDIYLGNDEDGNELDGTGFIEIDSGWIEIHLDEHAFENDFDRINISSSTADSFEIKHDLSGEFHVNEAGIKPRVFIGMAGQLSTTHGVYICLNECTSWGDHTYIDDAYFKIESPAGPGTIQVVYGKED